MRIVPVSLLVLLSIGLVPLPSTNAAPPAVSSSGPFATIALIDGGINPYHAAFRDSDPIALQHPSTYLPGYPTSAIALNLCFDTVANPDCATFAGARAHDATLWDTIVPGQLYYAPGTKIVGLMCAPAGNLGNCVGGGHNCQATAIPPSVVNRPNVDTSTTPPTVTFGCKDWQILDDHGHGTMTASRAAANTHSLCPTCRIVEIEGLGSFGVKWAADQGWIDIQTNSWLNLVPPPANQLRTTSLPVACLVNPGLTCPFLPDSTSSVFAYAQSRMLTIAASGNGAGYINGLAPTPTWVLSTAAPGVVLVGAHDNGRVASWSGAPAHIIADGYGGWRANNTDLAEHSPHPVSCCTSSSAPYAAGAAGQILTWARTLLNDTGTGVHDGILATAGPGATIPSSGPLRDGVFTLDELKSVLYRTAQARPVEGADDGLLQWVGNPAGGPSSYVAQHGPGANPFCQGCWTSPVNWTDVPPSVQQAALIGYGAVNEYSLGLASDVLQGTAPLPDRPHEDAFFKVDNLIRSVFFVGT